MTNQNGHIVAFRTRTPSQTAGSRLGTPSVTGMVGRMSSRAVQLPEALLQLRRKYQEVDATALSPPSEQPEIIDLTRAWARALSTSGELRRRIEQVAEGDPDLETQ